MRLRYLVPSATAVVLTLFVVGIAFAHSAKTSDDVATAASTPVKYCVNGLDPAAAQENTSFTQTAIATTGHAPLQMTSDEDHCFATKSQAETYAKQHNGVTITESFSDATPPAQ